MYVIKTRFDITTLPKVGFCGGSDCKVSACQCRRPRFNPWVRKIPWRREWLFTPGESHGSRTLVGYIQFMGLQRVTEWLTPSLSMDVYLSIKFLNFIFGYSWLTTQQRDSAIHIQVPILPQTPFPSRLPHSTEQSSPCYTEGYPFKTQQSVHMHPRPSDNPFPSSLPPGNHEFVP